jgi:hypothetical protein
MKDTIEFMNAHIKERELLHKIIATVLYRSDSTSTIDTKEIEDDFSKLTYRQIMYIILLLDKEEVLNREKFSQECFDELTFEKIQLCIL